MPYLFLDNVSTLSGLCLSDIPLFISLADITDLLVSYALNFAAETQIKYDSLFLVKPFPEFALGWPRNIVYP